MAQSNVAREPSMEEILASIRKIIESNDDEDSADAQNQPTLEAQEGEDGDHEDVPPVMRAANEQTRPGAVAPPGTANRPEKALSQTASSVAPATGPVATPPKPPRADAGAAARTVSQPGQRPVSLAEVAAEAENSSKAQTGGTNDSRSGEVLSTEPGRRPVSGTAAERADQGPQPDGDRMMRPSAPARAGDSADVTQQRTRALISAEAGSKVAASFGSLSQALVKAPERSLDQIAEDMLRPMLQQWLDDNLPTLVERLVREEIERVARGS